MKNVIHLPLISPKHYDAFRNILKDNLPGTYDEWEKLHRQQVTDCIRQGLAYSEVPISPEAFSAYCRANGYPPKTITLRKFAREKPPGKPNISARLERYEIRQNHFPLTSFPCLSRESRAKSYSVQLLWIPARARPNFLSSGQRPDDLVSLGRNDN